MIDVHHWLILLGRYICVARKPKCGACLIEDLCEFKDKTEYTFTGVDISPVTLHCIYPFK